MNKYFIGISEPGEDFSGERLSNHEKDKIYGSVVVHDGKFYIASACMNGGFITLSDQSGKEESKQVPLDEISLLKTIEKATFVELTRRMRQHQKDFFTSKPGTAFKQESLQKARAYEKEVDLVLAAMDNTQLKMSL